MTTPVDRFVVGNRATRSDSKFMSFAGLSRATRYYILFLCLAGVAAMIASFRIPGEQPADFALLAYFILTLITARMNVKIPFSDTHFSVDTAFVFVILILYGPLWAITADAAGKLILSASNINRDSWYKVPFNISSGVISIFAASFAFHYLLGGPIRTDETVLLPILAMTVVYFLVNTVTVAVVICLIQKANLVKFWVQNFLPTGLGYLATGSIGTFVFIVDVHSNYLGFFVTVPLLALVFFSQKIYLKQENNAKEHIRELTQINRKLEQAMEDYRRSTEENAVLERQLLQSQKMEAIGKLAGGVAHDFNNLLTGINGYTEILLADTDVENPAWSTLGEILKAGNRAADLTGKLLAFSRKQIIKPKVIDLNQIIADSEKMLGRIIGEDINLSFVPAKELSSVKADPGQIDQVLVNLVVNARDAMPTGGELRIETAQAYIEEYSSVMNEEFKPGGYVMLAISDKGVGMDEGILQRIFEPFFTTKEEGKGTGLGLATVYGIVKQNNGFIDIETKKGAGTTFKIFLPVCAQVPETLEKITENSLYQGDATILLVDDEEMIRSMAHQILEKQGYKVLVAENGEKALAIIKNSSDNIDLLLTDIVMPGISGKQLADQAIDFVKNLRILFMSGYPDEVIGRHGVLDRDTNFLQKPFSMNDLTQKVYEVLEQ